MHRGLCLDKRLIVDGARIGATELKVGVSFPVFAVDCCCTPAGRCGAVDARRRPGGRRGGLRRGLAHRVVGAEDLATEAVALAGTLARLDPRAYALAKATTRRHALAVADDEACREIDRQVLAQWQDDTTRASLDRLRKPKG